MKLINDIIEAHGGIERWNQFTKIEADIVSGGGLFTLKGVPQDTAVRHMTVWLQQERASVHPFGSPNQRSNFAADRVAIETLDGKVVTERTGTPEEMIRHLQSPQWDPLHRAFFNGYALWIYLTTPFFLTLPGLDIKEIAPLQEGTATWKGISVTFPPHIATHSREQQFYFGEDNLIRRHDYHVDAAGFYAGQYISELKEVQGIMVATKRRAYKKDKHGNIMPEELMVKIDLNNFQLS